MSEHTPTSAQTPEEKIVQLQEQNSALQQQIDVLQQQVAKQNEELSAQKEIATQQAATIAQLQATLTQEKPLLDPSLPEQQREVLQAILELPEDAFGEAEKLMEPLVGLPMTQTFCNSFKAVLKKKSWGVVCPTCERPSTVVWVTNPRNAKGGKAVFTHTGPSPHGSLAKIHKLIYMRKLDRRRKSK